MSKFTYITKAGKTLTLPSITDLPAGALRKARALPEMDMMFTIIEEVASPEAIATLDAVPLSELNALFAAWQADAGVNLPES